MANQWDHGYLAEIFLHNEKYNNKNMIDSVTEQVSSLANFVTYAV